MKAHSKIRDIIEDNILWLGIFISGLYWISDALIQVHLFNNGTLAGQIFSPTSYEIWTRVVVSSIMISSSAFVQSYITERKGAQEIVQEAGEKYLTLFNSANDAIFLMEKELFAECNPKTLELFGCTREQIVGQPPYKFSPEYQADGQLSRKKAKEKINAALNGEPQRFEWKHCQYDGTLFDAEVNLNRMRLSGKTYLQAIVRDITERKQAESALKASEENYRSLINGTNYSITLFDLRNNLIMINDAGAKYLGGAINDFIGKSIGELFPDKAELLTNRNREITKTGERREYEDELRMPSGQVKWWCSSLQPLKNSSEITTGVLVVSHDITDKKNMNESIREKESLLQAILESTGDGILVVNREGQVTHTNARFAELWKIPDDLIKKRDDDKLLSYVLDQLVDPEAFLTKVRKLYNSPEKDTDYLEFKDGRVFERYSYALIRQNVISGRVWNFKDITGKNRSAENRALQRTEVN